MFDTFLTALKRFQSDKRGTAAFIFAVTAIPTISLVGAAIDYNRAVKVQNELQNALDAGALAASHLAYLDDASVSQIEAVITDIVQGHLQGTYGVHSLQVTAGIDLDDALVDVFADIKVDTYLLGIMGVDEITVRVDSAVQADTTPTEIALVLDNTGSMARQMRTLRTAAQNFVNVVTEEGRQSQVSVSLVPYVASVNIGNARAHEAYLDIAGQSQYHASILEDAVLGQLDSCGPQEAAQGQSNNHQSLFGIRAAFAENPYSYTVDADCNIRNPSTISHWDLFRATDSRWKGCVEARPAPYDVLDTPPNPREPDTMWVPYFWADDTELQNGSHDNHWIDDTPFLEDSDMASSIEGRALSVLKYSAGNGVRIDENPPETDGPNKSCGDPILPLTNDYDELSDRIQAMIHWNSGGTQTVQGAVWGWRTLSPSPPFTEGAPYGEADKFMVIMTDGVNFLTNSNNPALESSYSAYGNLALGRMGDSRNDARRHIDRRMIEVCHNAKAEGITVFTVTFKLRDGETRLVWDQCASGEDKSYHVDSADELVSAFVEVARSIQDLRLVR
ncbi:MAG: TadE/TadG family type IV pilus assembly protein [Pseudomonadota bacterium]